VFLPSASTARYSLAKMQIGGLLDAQKVENETLHTAHALENRLSRRNKTLFSQQLTLTER